MNSFLFIMSEMKNLSVMHRFGFIFLMNTNRAGGVSSPPPAPLRGFKLFYNDELTDDGELFRAAVQRSNQADHTENKHGKAE